MTRHLCRPLPERLFGLRPEDELDLEDVTERVEDLVEDLDDEGPEVVLDQLERRLEDALEAVELADSKAERREETLSAAALVGAFIVVAYFVDGADVDFVVEGAVADQVVDEVSALAAGVVDGPERVRDAFADALEDAEGALAEGTGSEPLCAALAGALLVVEHLAWGGAA